MNTKKHTRVAWLGFEPATDAQLDGLREILGEVTLLHASPTWLASDCPDTDSHANAPTWGRLARDFDAVAGDIPEAAREAYAGELPALVSVKNWAGEHRRWRRVPPTRVLVKTLRACG